MVAKQGIKKGNKNSMKTTQNNRNCQKMFRPYPEGPKPKYLCNVINNEQGLVTQGINDKITWNRDTSGARNTLYKGVCAILNLPLHPNLVRPPRLNRALTTAEKQADSFKRRPVATISELLRDIHITPPVQNNAQNEVQNGQQDDAPNIVENNAQNEAQVDQQNQQNVPGNDSPIIADNNAPNEAQIDQQNQQNVPESVQAMRS